MRRRSPLAVWQSWDLERMVVWGCAIWSVVVGGLAMLAFVLFR